MNWIARYFSRLESFLVSHKPAKGNIWWFVTAIHTLLIVKILLLWPRVYQFYDISQQTTVAKLSNPINWFTKTFLFFNSPNLNLATVFALCMILLALIRKNSATSFIAFVICLNYDTLVSKAINGGDYISAFFCLIAVFLNSRTKIGENRQLVVNAAWLMLKINFCILYFVNAYGKIIKKIWLNGDAIYQSWNLDYFANPNLIPNFFYNRSFCIVTGWGVIIFEFTFAFLIWYQTPRKALLIIGLVFHLGIGLFLSLPDFALTMLIGYIPFLKPERLSNKKAVQPLEPL